jgi:hypothetical protein
MPTTEITSTIGWTAVAIAIVTWGSWSIPLRIKPVQRLNIDPVISQLYVSIAVFVSSWLLLTYNSFQFTYYGIIGAGMFIGCVFIYMCINTSETI